MVSADDEDAGTGAVLCDFCASEPAVVYCRADSARLCLSCDREVHAANTVSSRHNRSLLCDSCGAAPAAIFCSTPPHRLVLCSNCDFNAHQAGDHHHARHALDPFSGCPSGAVLAAALNLGDEKDTLPIKGEDGWAWESPPVFSWDDLIISPATPAFHGYQAMGIPPPLKDNDSSCGKRKEEIHRQIRRLIKGESDGVDYSEDIVPDVEFRSLLLENLQLQNGPNTVFMETPSFEKSFSQLNCIQHNLDDSQVDQSIPTVRENPPSMPQKDELPDRSTVISRYKEKRKARRYDKLIRYESRKVRADSRARIKGRFARANQVKKS